MSGRSRICSRTFASSIVTDTAQTIKLLQEAINQRDLEQIQYYAHQLKGASGNMRINSMQEIAKKLEKIVDENHLVDGNNLIFQLEERLQAIQLFINQISADKSCFI